MSCFQLQGKINSPYSVFYTDRLRKAKTNSRVDCNPKQLLCKVFICSFPIQDYEKFTTRVWRLSSAVNVIVNLLNFRPFGREKSKWPFINKLPAKPTIEAVLRLATSEVNLRGISIYSFRVTRSVLIRVLDCRKIIVCRCLRN